MFRHLFLILLLVISLFLGCQGRSLLYQSDNRSSVQTSLIITSEPSAQVEIDGKYLGVTPIRLGGTKVGIEPGERKVVISSGDGYNLETIVEGSGSITLEPDKDYYSILNQEDSLLIEEGKALIHHVVFEMDQVELTGEGDLGWSFQRWKGDVEGSENPIHVVMDENKKITAVFTYEVSGVVEDALGTGIGGVEISFSEGYDMVTTEEDGKWSKDGFHKQVSVIPRKDGYLFIPENKTVSGPSLEVNFTASYTIGGRVIDEVNNGIRGVEIAFSEGYSSVTTGEDGHWSKSGLSGSLVVTPIKNGYGFHLASRTVNGPSLEVNFTGGYEIRGRVIDEENNGVAGVEISFSRGYSSVTTREDGHWNKNRLSGSVIVTPSRSGYGFTPASREITGPVDDISFTRIPLQAGERTSYTVEDIEFFMRLAPALTFPTGTRDTESSTVDSDFLIAETHVTYELWYSVRMWALDNGYTFYNIGREGSNGDFGEAPSNRKNEPVASLNWYSSIVWCNALSEMLGYDPVYMVYGNVVKDSQYLTSKDLHEDIVAEETNGFRLPTSDEWELAARYQGRDSSYGAIEYPAGSGQFFTPGNYASGATGPAWDYDSFEAGDVEATKKAAWYSDNSDVDGSGRKSQDVGQKPASGNGLGLFDMSGNIHEWCFTQVGSGRSTRGGGYWSSLILICLGRDSQRNPSSGSFAGGPNGFRLARSVR